MPPHPKAFALTGGRSDAELPLATVTPSLLAPWECSTPGATFERVQLDDRSWVDIARGWLADPDEVFEAVRDRTRWDQEQAFRHERYVPEPRLSSVWKPGHPMPHPAVADAHAEMQRRYRVPFEGFALTRYRDGRDSTPFQRCRELRWLENTVVGVLTLGVSRPFLLRPASARLDHADPEETVTRDLRPASGDLLVMGGRCQTDWEHSVPKAFGVPEATISLVWRWTSRQGRPELGPSPRAPRRQSR